MQREQIQGFSLEEDEEEEEREREEVGDAFVEDKNV